MTLLRKVEAPPKHVKVRQTEALSEQRQKPVKTEDLMNTIKLDIIHVLVSLHSVTFYHSDDGDDDVMKNNITLNYI